MLFVFESPDNENAFLDVADTVEGVPIITSNAETLARAWHLGRRMDSSATALPRQEAAVLDASGDKMTATPCRPLPVGGVPAWLLGPLSAHLQPLFHLTPSRLQFVAELIRQGRYGALRITLSPSASIRSYTRLTLDIDEHLPEGHRSILHYRPEPVPTTSYRGTKGHSYTYGVSPQQVET